MLLAFVESLRYCAMILGHAESVELSHASCRLRRFSGFSSRMNSIRRVCRIERLSVSGIHGIRKVRRGNVHKVNLGNIIVS